MLDVHSATVFDESLLHCHLPVRFQLEKSAFDAHPQSDYDAFAVLSQYDYGPVEGLLRELVFRREFDLSSDRGIPQPFRVDVHRIRCVHGVCVKSYDDQVESHTLGLQTADIAQNAHEFEIMAYGPDETVRN